MYAYGDVALFMRNAQFSLGGYPTSYPAAVGYPGGKLPADAAL